jgi:peptidoglycan/xylan/chitin deacetylase (PgdA/CDA1 family)
VQRDRLPGGDGKQDRRDAVVVYHAIGSVPRSAPQWNGFVRPERFAEQMAYLAERRRVVDLDALFEPAASPGRPRVAITFDDAYRSALEYAVPVLHERGLPAAFFVPTKWIGERNAWDPPGAAPLELMTGEELAELARSGFAIESHGHAHLDYARAEPRAAEDDVRTSVERLTELLGRPPRYLAYPYGRAAPAAAAEAARLGLRGAFTLDRPQQISGDFAVPRTPVVPADTRQVFALKTAGRYIGWRHSAPVRVIYGALRPLVRNRWLWP